MTFYNVFSLCVAVLLAKKVRKSFEMLFYFEQHIRLKEPLKLQINI